MLVDGDFNVKLDNSEGATRAEKNATELASGSGVASRRLSIKVLVVIVGTIYRGYKGGGSGGGGRYIPEGGGRRDGELRKQ